MALALTHVALTLDEQRQMLEERLISAEARSYASRLVNRRNPGHSPTDVIDEAWLRINQMIGRRDVPMAGIGSAAEAARYIARTLDNVSRDLARQETRRQLLAAHLAAGVDQVHSDASLHSSALLLQVLGAIGERSRLGVECRGCESALVTSSALETIHLIAEGHGDGSGSRILDEILHEALSRMAPHLSTSSAARRQRKARCGPCVRELIEASLADLGIAA